MTGGRFRGIPVVGKEKEQSVLLEAQFHQLGPDLLDPLVHLEDHLLHGLGVRGGSLPRPRPALNGIVGTLDGRMRRLVGNVEAKGLVLVLLEEFQGILVDKVGGIALFRSLFSPVPPVVLHVVTPVVDIVDVSAVVAHEVIEAVVLRMVFRVLARVTQVPLAHHAGSVAGLLEQLGESDLGLAQPLAVFGMVGMRMNDGLDPNPLLVAPREQAGPGG